MKKKTRIEEEVSLIHEVRYLENKIDSILKKIKQINIKLNDVRNR